MKRLLFAALLLLMGECGFAQLKIGSNPSTINKSSILELESTRQGLLLPRIPGANLTTAPLSTAPDGMIIYVTDSTSLFIRKNGLWQRMSADSVANAKNWNTTGNAGLDSTVNFLGTTDAQPLIVKTNGAERLRVTSNGNLKVASGTVPVGSNQVQVMVIDTSTGTIVQRSLSAAAFDNAIVSLNGLRDSVQNFAVDSAQTTDFTITSSNGVHTFNIPTQNGNGVTSRGLLSYHDWLRFDSAYRFQILHTLFSTAPDSTGMTLSNGTLILHAADATHPGGVDTTTQTFGGAKTFNGNVVANQNATVNGNLVLTNTPQAPANDSVSVLIQAANGTVQQRTIGLAAFKQLVTGTDSGTVKDIHIDSSSATQTVIDIPDASPTVRGVVNHTSGQSFGGYKNFKDSLAVGLATGTTANSTFQVNGSIGSNITKVTGNYTVAATDNTVLADATSAAITITLPNPGTINGRIYTIKKIGTGGIDNALTITPTSGTIDGGANYIIYNDWTFVCLQTDGTNWYVIKK
ncbi:hypothetical protein [Dinghuibacter silviterrae]|nr:hypothetical protein [Dinghuibacter silviterrae]